MIATVSTREDLYRQFIPAGTIGAELGVYTGTNAYQLYRLTHPAVLYLVDPYPQADGPEARQHARALLPHKNCEWVEAWDWDWLPTLPVGHLAWVYLDTLHYRAATVRELPVIVAALGPGGILAGHDFCIHPLFGSGVIAPVLDCVQEGRLELLALTENHPFPSFAARVR